MDAPSLQPKKRVSGLIQTMVGVEIPAKPRVVKSTVSPTIGLTEAILVKSTILPITGLTKAIPVKSTMLPATGS